jgi:transcriptional regulator with XRE-family HTH domain
MKTVREAFSERLVEAMKDNGYEAKRGAKSGADAAKLRLIASVTQEMASRYLTAKALPDPEKMAKIATALNVSLPWLRDGLGPKKRGGLVLVAANNEIHLSDESIRVAKDWEELQPKEKKQFADEIRALAIAERIKKRHENVMPVTSQIDWEETESPTDEINCVVGRGENQSEVNLGQGDEHSRDKEGE